LHRRKPQIDLHCTLQAWMLIQRNAPSACV
jgi:hypothetical protein